jgi:hypothetical protein
VNVLVALPINLKTRKLIYWLMRIRVDSTSKKILKHLAKASEPLETKELEDLLPKETRVKILYRLNLLRGDGLIKGKVVGSGKGAWVWWHKEMFNGKK